jgi:4-hydroxymandelate oxidase
MSQTSPIKPAGTHPNKQVNLHSIFSLPEFEAPAKAILDHRVFEYIRGGAGDEITLRENRTAFDRIFLRPRVLVDVKNLDTSIELFGRKFRSPLILAPAAYQLLVHPDGELGTVHGAGERDVPVIVSTRSNIAIEELVSGAKTPIWFQLYVKGNRSQTENLIHRVESAGVEGICVTVDSPVLGTRLYELRAGFDTPKDLPFPNDNSSNYDGREGGKPVLHSPLTWKDLDWLRTTIKTKLFLKGILHPDDAELAIRCGVDGIIVSNHGARNLDTTLPTIDALPAIAETVSGRVPIILDGGIRSGTDVLKALLRGANAVMIGRSYLYALAVGGAPGVARCIELLQDDFYTALALHGGMENEETK